MAFKKKDWLTKEDIINSVMQKEHWKDSYLNDTRSATRVIQKYLNHYLYPKENIYGKDEKRSISSVSGKAISELKYMWGIHTIMPKNSNDKKDRNTNYHHTLDAFTVALCSTSAINTLHGFFKKKENAFKTKAMKENLTEMLPQTKDGVNVVEHLKRLVEKYETNQFYVCPYNKRKTNMKGFKDGNLKLYRTQNPKDETKEILAEMEKVQIDGSLLIKSVGGFPKPRNDKEVLAEIKSIQARLNPMKQQNIIDAIEVYANSLLKLRSEIDELDKEINKLNKTKKTGKQHKEHNVLIQESITPLSDAKKKLAQEQKTLRCSFKVKGDKVQVLRSLKLYKTKITENKADAIIFHQRSSNKIERLSFANYTDAVKNKEPFVIKENESTLYVELFNTKSRGQAVGLNYFSSIANDIGTKFNSRYSDELNKDSVADLVLYKNDIIKVVDTKKDTINYYVFNGGGLVAGSNNKLSIKNINLNSFLKINNKGIEKEIKEDNVTPNKTTVINKVKIDFFGNIKED
jgi:CRISPR/Cas system Type II protein with McrA/HNH and RuvC-like nuclease domain